MTISHHANRAMLRRIAHQTILERGLEPDLSAAVMAELASMVTPSASAARGRDLRHLGWASIDNGDSLDLDQLTVAQALPGGATRVLVAIADVDALVTRGSAGLDVGRRVQVQLVHTGVERGFIDFVLRPGHGGGGARVKDRSRSGKG